MSAEAIRDDLANTELLTTFYPVRAGCIGPAMPDLDSGQREIADRISEEVDYRREAANITAFSDLYRGHPFIRVPELVPEASRIRC